MIFATFSPMNHKKTFSFLLFLLSLWTWSQTGKPASLLAFTAKIDSIVSYGIQQQAYPGAQVLLYKKGEILLEKSYGFHTYDSLVPVNNNQLYDLASVTKVMASTLAFMKLYELYNIPIDARASDYIPLLKNSNKKNSTFRQILTHSAGWKPYLTHQNTVYNKKGRAKARTLSYQKSKRYPLSLNGNLYVHRSYPKRIARRIKKTDLDPVSKYVYSGLWFFLLPEMVEKISGMDFPTFLNQHFYRPLELGRIGFLPRQRFSLEEIVPTEKDSLFRKELVHGWVHDEAAALMGGVSGNAGLFANARSLAPLLEMLLKKGTLNNKTLLKEETVTLFTSPAYPASENRRGLGFDKPIFSDSGTATYPATLASRESYGHTGFTGTFIWVDPREECFIIFLSNRVYPSRSQQALYDLNIRGNLLDALIQY
jgi:serine-type D-Ala-D-Ala carboxypeptidase